MNKTNREISSDKKTDRRQSRCIGVVLVTAGAVLLTGLLSKRKLSLFIKSWFVPLFIDVEL